MLAFKDIGPKAPFHQLVIPIRHIGSLAEAKAEDAALLGKLLLVASRLAREAGYAERGFRVVMNSRSRRRPDRPARALARAGRARARLAAGVELPAFDR